MKLILGDCLEKLKDLDDNSVDSIVTDPPYGFSFMGKKWDYDVPSVDIWKECYRVLKYGGHLLAFGGSRTYHRLAVNVEDAGFEIRDQIMWIYGSGFPKSHNIGKAVDKKLGNERVLLKNKIKKAGNMKSGNFNKGGNYADVEINITKGNSQWEGWGTALKPSHEPIVMARKPLSEKSIADNVLKWGTGGINIDDSRIAYKSKNDMQIRENTHREINKLGDANFGGGKYSQPVESGRFPANIIFDEEASKILDEQSGTRKGWASQNHNKFNPYGGNSLYSTDTERKGFHKGYDDTGGASRFFYCAKTSKKDRDEGMAEFKEKNWVQFSTKNNTSGEPSNWSKDRQTSYKNIHPTVKPTKLMCYLVNLVTPKNGIVLDPFMGSGSTGKACVQKGFDFIGIEREEEYMDIAKARIEFEQKNKSEKLF